MTVYIYDRNSLQVIAMPDVRFLDKFKENPKLFYPFYDKNTMIYSLDELINPIIDNNEIREMTHYELIKNGKLNLNDGEYLNEENKTIVFIEKPNEWSIWDKNINKWIVDENLKNKKREELKNTLINDLIIAKNKFINQKIEIENNSKKYIFKNTVYDRENLFTKLSLMSILNQNKVEKIKVINDLGNIEFITLEINELKTLMTKIQDIIEISDVNEQTALTGMDRYSIEQLQKLDVNEFFTL
jgi:hypothetical protein